MTTSVYIASNAPLKIAQAGLPLQELKSGFYVAGIHGDQTVTVTNPADGKFMQVLVGIFGNKRTRHHETTGRADAIVMPSTARVVSLQPGHAISVSEYGEFLNGPDTSVQWLPLDPDDKV